MIFSLKKIIIFVYWIKFSPFIITLVPIGPLSGKTVIFANLGIVNLLIALLPLVSVAIIS